MIIICGIIGFSSTKVTDEDLDVLRKVIIASKIRGRHASGIAWADKGMKISSIIKPIPIDKLMEEIDLKKFIQLDGSLSLIAHARYSTSDIEYNQPIISKHSAIAHNGVITQADPSQWESQFGLTCKGKNDSELILRAYENDQDPFQCFPEASIAIVTLSGNGYVTGYRNGKRPLWLGIIGKGTVYASTYDILKRAGVINITKVKPLKGKDLQRRDWKQWKI